MIEISAPFFPARCNLDVAFSLESFAFGAEFRRVHHYINAIERDAPLLTV
jgi:hypothetical protein